MTKISISTLILFMILICCNLKAWSSQKVDRHVIERIEKTKKEALLKLYLDIFLASKDLSNAYYVAKIGCKRFPHESYWWKRLADICTWTNRPREAMKSYLRLYKITKKEEYKKKAFNLSVLCNRFDIAKDILEMDLKMGLFPELKDLVYIYEQSGYLFELIRILERRYGSTGSLAVLKILVRLYWSYGMVNKAIKAMEELEQKRPLSSKEALLFSEMLYSQRRYEDSLAILKRYIKRATKKDVEFWQTLSDLAWAEGDYLAAIKASSMLYKTKKARAIDYERLYLFYYSNNRFDLTLKYSIEGYKKYKKPYFFFAFLNTAILLKKWDMIIREIGKLREKELMGFAKDPHFIATQALVFIKTGNMEKGKRLLQCALRKGFNLEVLSYYLHILLETRNIKEIKDVIKGYERYTKDYNELIIPFVSCHLLLQDGRNALRLINLVPIKSYSNMLLKADILSLMGKEEEANKIRFSLWRRMKKRLKKEEKIIRNKEFLENFLRVAIHFEASPTLRRYMELGKRILDKNRYMNILISYLLYIGARQEAEFLIKRRHYPADPWVRLSLCLWKHDKYETERILRSHGDILPIRDRIEGLKRVGRIGEAMAQIFKGLDRNQYDSALWDQSRELVSRYKTQIITDSHYLKRGGYKEILNKSSIRTQKRGFFIKLTNRAESKISEDKETIQDSPSFIDETRLSITKAHGRQIWTGYIGMLDSLRTNPIFGIKWQGNMPHNTSLSVEVAYNKRADDTLFLYIGGMKRCINIQTSKPLMPRIFTTINSHYNRYYSQDNRYLGYGLGEYLELLYMLRLGYPDVGIRLYLQHETYDEKKGGKGVIEKISPYIENPILPESFNQMGFGIILGYQNKESISKKWKPFLKLDTSINDETGHGLSIEGGISAPILLGHDNLNIGINYIRGFRGTEDTYYNLYIKWRFGVD